MRYLTDSYINSAINRGKSIEQFLGGDGEIIKWISIRKNTSKFILSFFEVYDEGDIDYVDIYTFSPVDEDNEDGIEIEFNSLQESIECSLNNYDAQSDKFVNQFVVQDEYEDYKKNCS